MSLKHFSITYIISFFLILLIILFMALFSFKNHININKAELTGVPSLIINTDNNKRIKEKKKYIKGTVIKDGKTLSCKIRGHGNSTWKLPKAKKPYLLKLNEPANMFGMKDARKWILISNLSDQSSLRNAFAVHLARNVFNKQIYVPDYRFVNLFLNGQYEGLYYLSEKIEDELLNLPEHSFLFEVNRQDSRTWSFISEHDISFCLHNNDASEEEFLYSKKIIQDFENILYSSNYLDEKLGYKNYIDFDSFVDWYLINEFTKNRDADFSLSCYLYYNSKTKKIGMGPIWDFDLSCGANFGDDFSYNDLWIIRKGWYKRMYEDPQFRKAVALRWNNQKHLLKDFDKWINENSLKIKSAVLLNDSVWKTFGRKQWPHIPEWKKRKNYESHLEYMIEWLTKRYEWMDNEFNAPKTEE